MRPTERGLERELKKMADPVRAKNYLWFFKTGPGEYGVGDKFLGLKVPLIRKIARKYRALPLSAIGRLLTSPYHEIRLAALLILTDKFLTKGSSPPKQIFDFYLKYLKWGKINNWDLVDLTAPRIVGQYLFARPRIVLYKLARSENLWERRVAILSTFAFIKNNDFADALKIAKLLITDQHDLIHKAVGWMLREVGKKNQKVEEEFLKKYHRVMPRTMLRYAIERFPEEKRQRYLQKK